MIVDLLHHLAVEVAICACFDESESEHVLLDIPELAQDGEILNGIPRLERVHVKLLLLTSEDVILSRDLSELLETHRLLSSYLVYHVRVSVEYLQDKELAHRAFNVTS